MRGWPRRTTRNRLRAVGAALALAGLACGVLSPEEQLLADFFHAARLRDTTALANISTVDFNPRTDGIVQDFEIIDRERFAEDGGKETRRVTVSAQVRRMDGETEARILLITVQREGDGRWLVTALQPQAEGTPR